MQPRLTKTQTLPPPPFQQVGDVAARIVERALAKAKAKEAA
jgi:hypothetical protein